MQDIRLCLGLLALLMALASCSALPDETVALGPGDFTNPVFAGDFPDPDVIAVDGGYFAYATNSGGRNIQVARSPDLVRWELLGDALPALPAWAVQDFGYAWAPDVMALDGGYLMTFTARLALGTGGLQCIGAAWAEEPAGPFTPLGDGPLVCQLDMGGSIDPATFVDDDGRRYLLWKNDGNAWSGGRTWIFIQPLADDGRTLAGEPARLVTADQSWEGGLVEGPTLWKQDGRYVLFYSANHYASQHYGVGYAVAGAPLGPYEKASGPLLATSIPAGLVGPGGQDVVQTADGATWLLFHSWSPSEGRHLNLAPLRWEEGRPVVETR